MPSRKSKQRGEFLMARWILLALILGAMLAIPYWLKKNDDNKLKERAKAEADLNAGYKVMPETATLPSDNSARPISYGLTFAGAPFHVKLLIRGPSVSLHMSEETGLLRRRLAC